MATFNVYEEQENCVPGLKQKSASTSTAPQQKRTVFGVLGNKNERVQKKPLESSNVAKSSNENACNKDKPKTSNENAQNKENLKKSAPAIPVAQFEAFNVYEDDSACIQVRQRKLKENDISNIYKCTDQDRFITKKELVEMAKNNQDVQIPRLKGLVLDDKDESPMSIEKSFEIENIIKTDVIVKSKSNKDIFFEMEEYRGIIYRYLREREIFNRPKAGYMKKQPDITHNMRSILVDWLVEVTEEYKLHTETLYLAVNFIDRFLSYMSVVRGKLQLVGTAAMFIAAKYEEIFPPNVSEFVYITDDTYSKKQVIRMEHLIIKILSFDLSIPTPLTFITATCIINKQPEKIMFLAMYLSELAMLETEPYLETLPSVLASSAIALARHTLEEEAWTEDLRKNTGYELKFLQACVKFLNVMFVRAPTLPQQAIQEKYKTERFLHVAKLTPRDVDVNFD